MSAPQLTGNVIVKPDADDAIDAAATDLLLHAINCVKTFDSFHLALSGGSTPMPLYQRLMIDPAYRALPWTHTHLWIVDERRVPYHDHRSNFGAIRDVIVEHSGIPESNVHPMDPERDDADVLYERELISALASRGPGRDRLDYCLLGMGGDAHTASLFPRSPALSEDRRFVRINEGPTVTPPSRITLTLPIINATRFIAFLVTGEGKRDALKRVAAREEPIDDVPALGVKPLGGELRWYLDRAANPA